MEYGTRVLHELYGEGIVLRWQIGVIEILFFCGTIAVRADDPRLKVMEGVF